MGNHRQSIVGNKDNDLIHRFSDDLIYITKNKLLHLFASFTKWCYKIETKDKEVHLFDIYKVEHRVTKSCRCGNKIYAFPNEKLNKTIHLYYVRTED